MNHGSMPSIGAGRLRMIPTARARASDSARAAVLGLNPTSRATSRMRCRVADETPGWPFRA
jgi:hypothetical protein